MVEAFDDHRQAALITTTLEFSNGNGTEVKIINYTFYT